VEEGRVSEDGGQPEGGGREGGSERVSRDRTGNDLNTHPLDSIRGKMKEPENYDTLEPG